MTVTTTAPPLLTFPLEVAATVRLSPTFVRVTLTGEALTRFHPGGPLGPRDQRVKLLLPEPGRPTPDLADLSPGWYLRWRALPPAERGHLRTYTVRALRLNGPEPQLDLDFVLHGGSGPAGPGCTWAARARPGDRITVLGPNAAADVAAGIEWLPPAPLAGVGVRVLLVGDETAVPAASAVLESLPAGYRGTALLEVPGSADFVDLRPTGGVEVTWFARGRRPYGERLRQAVRALLAADPLGPVATTTPSAPEVDIDAEVLWDTPSFLGLHAAPRPEPCYVWVAGEAGMVRDLRRLLLSDHGLDRGSASFMGYWRQGRAELI